MFSKKRKISGSQPTLVQTLLKLQKVKKENDENQPPNDIGERKNADLALVGDMNLVENNQVTKLSQNSASSPSVEEKRIVAKMKLISKKFGGLVNNIGTTWFKALEPEFSKPYFEKLYNFLGQEQTSHVVYPPPDKIFTWTQITPIDKISVIIVGQDPYHGPNQAHGLCFSVLKGVQIPPSLENMYKELGSSTVGFRHPGHGNLIGWAEQGVLLLNSVLTVRRHEANSHKDKGWEEFTDAVMTWFNRNTKGTVFILWGSYAQKKGQKIDKNKHHILQGVHPSPLSAHRGFFGCNHFKLCNDLLKKEGNKEIDWNNLH